MFHDADCKDEMPNTRFVAAFKKYCLDVFRGIGILQDGTVLQDR